MLNDRTYVVNSPDLVAAVQRAVRSFSFDPIVAAATERMGLVSEAGAAALRYKPEGENGSGDDGRYAAIMGRVDEKAVRLFEWSRHTIIMASTNAFHGPANPFKNPEVEAAFGHKTFESNLKVLLVNIVPTVTTPHEHRAPDIGHRVYIKDFQTGDHASGSALVKVRHSNNVKYGVSPPDQARFEWTNAIGILANTVSATF
ncbi:hypothetical protein MMC13_004437 [Lambiella insularis]|nr:hypothetical protein [Lambiella insularis]